MAPRLGVTPARRRVSARYWVRAIRIPSGPASSSLHERAIAWFGSGERQLLAALPTVEDRRQFAVARIEVRRMLSDATGVPSAAIRLGAAPSGRPSMWAGPGMPEIDFNIGHCEGHVVIGLAYEGRIGVDVAPVRRDVESLAERVLLPDELRSLRALRPRRRPFEFARLWAVKEACVKACDLGLAALRSVHVGAGTSGRWGEVEWETLDLGRCVVGAVALAP